MHRLRMSVLAVAIAAGMSAGVPSIRAEDVVRSHPPLRTEPPPSQRPLGDGPTRFVSPHGDDARAGTKEQPWRTIAHALAQLRPGETLCLRGGTYYETVYVALAGREDAPITVRGYPGERAVIDGGLEEFFTNPAAAWEPFDGGAAGEYRSVRSYPNLRQVIGSFGDSMVGLQTYYHAADLRAENELIDWEDWDDQQGTDLKPLYCGPGLWYDPQSGYIHCRLAHTHLPEPVPNYRGETDPRKLPLVLAPYAAVTLTLDGAGHVRFEDLALRGGGYATVRLDQAEHVAFDNVTVWCGTYGMQATGTRWLKFLRSALYGNVAPWTFRADGSKRDYPGRPHRNISRLNTHALLELGSGRESSVYAFPQNDQWELAHSEFTDAHDGVYLGAVNVRFHHNLLENMQDDGIYLSPMYLRHRLEQRDPELHIEANVIRRVLTALAFGGPEPATADTVFVCRNVFDLRDPVLTGRPSTRRKAVGTSTGNLLGDHGSPPWSAMSIYQNTFVTDASRDAAMGTLTHMKANLPRRTYNNIFVHTQRPAAFPLMPVGDDVLCDGNLYWSPTVTAKQAEAFFERYRKSEHFAKTRTDTSPGNTTHSLVADPRFVDLTDEPAESDYRLRADSPAVDAGVPLPDGWPDPLRDQDDGQPDIGALPHNTAALAVGRPR